MFSSCCLCSVHSYVMSTWPREEKEGEREEKGHGSGQGAADGKKNN